MFLTNEMRLASCSLVALMMMSIPGLANYNHHATALKPVTEPPTAPALAIASRIPPKKQRFTRLRSQMHGIASWYGAVLNGHKTASGEVFDMNKMTACHRTLPFGTMVKVTDTHTGKSVIVRINDRGVLFADRVIDLSRGAAERLGIRRRGVANVRLQVLSKKEAEREMASVNGTESEPDSSSANPIFHMN